MDYTIGYLKEHSNLPGPRGNLSLLYEFAAAGDEALALACLAEIDGQTRDSPEEFAGMCGIVAYAAAHRSDRRAVVDFLRPYASHSSWRIREAVAMAIQEIAVGALAETLDCLAPLAAGNPFERRAVVAGLCEPKLLRDPAANAAILELLARITAGLDRDGRLDESETALRKALAYGWSVVVAHEPAAGKAAFAALLRLRGKHVRWIMRENLKKNRLAVLDREWVADMERRLAEGPSAPPQ